MRERERLVTQIFKKPQGHGFSMIEVMMSLLIFLMIALMFGAAIPAATRGTRFSGTFQQAISLAQHKIDQLREAGGSRLTPTSMETRQIIDSAAGCSAASTTNTCYFTTIDAVTSYFGTGSIGKVVITPYAPSYITVSNTYTLWTVTVTVTWKDATKATHSYSTSAIISMG